MALTETEAWKAVETAEDQLRAASEGWSRAQKESATSALMIAIARYRRLIRAKELANVGSAPAQHEDLLEDVPAKLHG